MCLVVDFVGRDLQSCHQLSKSKYPTISAFQCSNWKASLKILGKEKQLYDIHSALLALPQVQKVLEMRFYAPTVVGVEQMQET